MSKPVAWAIKSDGDFTEIGFDDDDLQNIELWYAEQGWSYEYVPLYTHPHPDNLGLALSIIDQQKLEIENLRKADLTQKSLCKAELTKKDVEAARKEGYEFGYAQGCMHEKYGINGTNPVKELTDDEVIKLWDSIDIVPYQGITGRLKVFARAILRKAQE